MNKNKLLASLILPILFSSLVAALPSAYATPTIDIKPALTTFGNAAGDPIPIPGTQFTVTVAVHDGVDIFGFAVVFRWNTVYLGYVSKVITTGFELPVSDVVNTAAGTYELAMSRMGVPKPPGYNGYVWLFNITLEVIKQPWDYETGGPGVDPIDTLLDFVSTDLSDSNAQPIVHFVNTATVRIWERLFVPPPAPVLQVLPALVENKPFCTSFDSEIWITGLDPYYDIAGFDVVVSFDPTLIEATAITSGGFLESYASAVFVVVSTIDNVAGNVHFAEVQLPPRTAEPASGILFKITFHVIYESLTYPPPQCAIAIGPSDLPSFPHPEIPSYPYYSKPWSVPIAHTVVDGTYKAKFKPMGATIDLYVCDFPEPFKGIGPNVPSEGYAPQKLVHLKALVTYNLWPVQFKPVTFEIHDPQGNVVAVRTAFSNESGIAVAEYRLPWPCEEWPDMFGIWTVIATVDVYCKVVNDTLQFKLWWPLELLTVTPSKASYQIFEHTSFEITMRTCFVMSYTATIVLTLYDDVGQPIGYRIVTVDYGLNDISKWCQWQEITITIECIQIPKFAAPGVGTAYVVALRNMPWVGGDALCPEISVHFGIEVPP
jgi:hypothetical protein